MNAAEELWEELHHLFDTDDGSLPEVVFGGLGPGDLEAAFALLRSRADPDALAGQTVWDEQRRADVPMADVPDAVARVADERNPSFHVVFRALRSEGVALPALGVFVDPDSLALDYRMGSDWDERTLAAFVRLVGDILAVAPHATVAAVPDGGRMQYADPAFGATLRRFLARA